MNIDGDLCFSFRYIVCAIIVSKVLITKAADIIPSTSETINWKARYSSLQAHAESLSSKLYVEREDRKCVDFYQFYVPSLLTRFMNLSYFTPEFIKKNKCFYYSIKNFIQTNNVRELIQMDLREIGMELVDRKKCKFKHLSKEELSPEALANVKRTSKKRWRADNANECEHYIHFFHALWEEGILNEPELVMWKNVITAYSLDGMPYPYLIQRILYCVQCSNQYHRQILNIDGQNNRTNEDYFKTEEWTYEKAKDLLYCLFKRANLASYTPQWTPPVEVQAFSKINGTPSSTTTFTSPTEAGINYYLRLIREGRRRTTKRLSSSGSV